MLTFILSAVCALSLNAAPADTLDKYIINGEQVVKFDGSQLVGKTVSDYKVTVAKSITADEAVRIHVIRTDGQKIKAIKSSSVVESFRFEDKDAEFNIAEFNIDGKNYSNAEVTVLSSTPLYIVDGKKCDKDAFAKIKPESIASMTVYKPGSKGALKLSGKSDVAVIVVVTK